MASSSAPSARNIHLPKDDMILDDKIVCIDIKSDNNKYNTRSISLYQDDKGILRINKNIIRKIHADFVPRNAKLLVAYNELVTDYLTISEIDAMISQHVSKSSKSFNDIQRFIDTSLDYNSLIEKMKTTKHNYDEFRLKQLLSQDSLLNGNLEELIELKKRYPKLNLSIFTHSKWTNMIDFINIFSQ